MIEILRFAQKRSSIPKGAKVKDLLIRLTCYFSRFQSLPYM